MTPRRVYMRRASDECLAVLIPIVRLTWRCDRCTDETLFTLQTDPLTPNALKRMFATLYYHLIA